jgi:hypothetical protein
VICPKINLKFDGVSGSFCTCQNLQSKQIAGFIRISQIKTPNFKKMGLYNSTMAISTGFTAETFINGERMGRE